MNQIIKFIILLITGLVILALFLWMMEWGMERQEQYECQKWQTESEQYADKGYFLPKWSVDQCNHYGIEINAN
jgi:hypothetical protein